MELHECTTAAGHPTQALLQRMLSTINAYCSLRPVELPTPLNMPHGTLAQQAHAVVQAAAEGDIAPSQAAQIITALGGVAKIVETTELLARIEVLESKHGKS